MKSQNSMYFSLYKIIGIYSGFTFYFYLLLFTLFKFVKSSFAFNPAVYWFITGYFLFIPMFILVYLKIKPRNFKDFLCRANLNLFNKKDWLYAILGLISTFIFSGMIFFVVNLILTTLNLKPLETNPWFFSMKPFIGVEKFLLLLWFPMFFFNIVGEELLWRAYIQKNSKPRYWWINSLLWLMFHLPFGFDLMIMLIPIMIIIPYLYYKTSNTLIGIFIHGMYNGPIFIMISLGLLPS